MTQTQVTGRVAGIHIQVHQRRGLVVPRAEGGEIHRSRRGSHAAFDSNEGVHPAERAILPMDALRVLLEANQGLAEFRALQRLLQEVGATQAHGAQQKLFTGLEAGKNHVERGDRLPQLLQRAQTLLGIG